MGRDADWIVIGGSYPGALVAWFKSQYPDYAVGAWSSSGVIHAIKDYKMFESKNSKNLASTVSGINSVLIVCSLLLLPILTSHFFVSLYGSTNAHAKKNVGCNSQLLSGN